MNQNFQNLIIVGNSNRFATNHHEDIQLVNILHSEDFFFEISSPLRIFLITLDIKFLKNYI